MLNFENGYYEGIRPEMRESLTEYVLNHRRTGGFLHAALTNQFALAVIKADKENLAAIKEYAMFFCNEIPSDCWGSKEQVRAWLTDEPSSILRDYHANNA